MDTGNSHIVICLLEVKKAVLIDSGLGIVDMKEVVDSLTALEVIVITTHVHWDHIGSHSSFQHIAVHESEAEFLSSWFPIPKAMVMMGLCGNNCNFPEGFDPSTYEVYHQGADIFLHDKDTIDLGNRTLTIYHTPGHSPGHICIYEKQRGYLFSGDLIYKGTLDAFYFSTDPIAFMHSIDAMMKLNIKKILPGHFDLSIQDDLLVHIQEAFHQLHDQHLLVHGSGVFAFQDFKIHV